MSGFTWIQPTSCSQEVPWAPRKLNSPDRGSQCQPASVWCCFTCPHPPIPGGDEILKNWHSAETVYSVFYGSLELRSDSCCLPLLPATTLRYWTVPVVSAHRKGGLLLNSAQGIHIFDIHHLSAWEMTKQILKSHKWNRQAWRETWVSEVCFLEKQNVQSTHSAALMTSSSTSESTKNLKIYLKNMFKSHWKFKGLPLASAQVFSSCKKTKHILLIFLQSLVHLPRGWILPWTLWKELRILNSISKREFPSIFQF